MIVDIEDLLESVRTYVKANLNTKIASINTEKDDDYDIDIIEADDEHYVFGADNLDLPNHAFVNLAISEITPKQVRGNISFEVLIIVEVAFDNPKKSGTMNKSLRYMRAIYEIMSGYQADEVDSPQITLAKPMLVALTNRQLVVSGIEFSCGISS